MGLLAACETKSFFRSATLGDVHGGRSIVLMPVDIELGELLAGGAVEPKAEWTDQGRELMTAAIDARLTEQNARLIVANPAGVIDNADSPELALMKLHGAVGNAIFVHKLSDAPTLRLPSKADKFDWSLGPDVKVLRDRYASDYALFVFMRDTYASAGRVAAIVVAAALGVGIPGGAQIGYASLVDLRTGDVVWTNRLRRGSGDLRKPDGAANTVALLLDQFPK
jgi:hypothetical protein